MIFMYLLVVMTFGVVSVCLVLKEEKESLASGDEFRASDFEIIELDA